MYIMKKINIISAFIFIVSCSMSTLANESRGELLVEYTKTDISCFGQSNGKIELCVNGGKSPYTIEWDHGSNSMVLENLKKGDYSVKVTDANGKIVAHRIKIDMPAPLTIQYNSIKETIVDVVNGSMNAMVSGGTPWEVDNNPYYFIQLDGKSQFENTEALEDGIYKINIKDAQGCAMNVPVNINFEVVEAKKEKQIIENEEVPYNGYGYVKMSIYKKGKGNLVVLDDDIIRSIK